MPDHLSNQASLWHTLTRIVIVALLPMGLFAGLLFYLLWDNQQAQRNAEQLARVRTMAVLLESEMDDVIGRMQVIVDDPLIDSHDYRALHVRCRQWLATNADWENIVLRSREKQVVNVALPDGTALPARRQSDSHEQAFRTLRPAISNLHLAPVRGAPTITVAVPVLRNGKADFVLTVALKREHLSEILRRVVPDGGVASVFDATMQIVARTNEQSPDVVGASPGKQLLEAMSGAKEGAIRTTTREGTRMFTTWTTTRDGWWVATGTPSAAADRALMRYAGLLGVAWLVMLVAGFAMARLFSRRLEARIRTTIDVATQLAEGHPAEFPRTNIREFTVLSNAIATLFTRERKARAESDAANSAKDEFLAMLGHELRNPIGAIANAVHIAGDATRSIEHDALARRVIVRQTQILKRIIDDLLDIGRAITGKIVLELQPLELSACVKRAVETLAAAGKTSGRRIDVDAAEAWIEGDSARIEQVLSNLLLNAINHTSANGIISVRLVQESGEALITVRDNGVGIAPESLPRIFELFYQDEKRADRPKGGLGIGLTLVARLARLHRGTITATSEGAGTGAAFTVRIPSIAGGRSEQEIQPALLRHGNCRVLIIEDNVDARETLCSLLELQGYTVQSAGDGPAGIALIRSFVPEVIIVDIGLPEMNGYAVARAIRANVGRRVKLIALTGYGAHEDEDAARAAGFDAHLVKPVDMMRLAALLQVQPATV